MHTDGFINFFAHFTFLAVKGKEHRCAALDCQEFPPFTSFARREAGVAPDIRNFDFILIRMQDSCLFSFFCLDFPVLPGWLASAIHISFYCG